MASKRRTNQLTNARRSRTPGTSGSLGTELSTVGQPANYNPRKISDERLEDLGRSQREFGDLSGIVVNVQTGNVVGGHQRIKTLDPSWRIRKRGMKDQVGTVALGYIDTPDRGRLSYREVDWPLEREKAANLAANKIQGEWDTTKLAPLLEGLTVKPELFDLTGFAIQEANLLIASLEEERPDADLIPAPPEKPLTKPGQMIRFGPLRLLCADATKLESYRTLLGDVKASVCITDPPYGVDYEFEHGKGFHLNQLTHRKECIPKRSTAMVGDHSSDVALRTYPLIFKHLDPQAAAYIFAGTNLLIDTVNWLRQEKIHYGILMVWDKGANVVSWNHYHPGHENIIFCGQGSLPGGGNKRWFGPKDESKIWHIPIDDRGHKMHRAQKPVELYKRALINSSVTGDIMIDPFAGSGRALIAAQETKRRAYLMEIDPRNCDLIINRWVTFTGHKRPTATQPEPQ